ncbi:MAG: TolC family protein, partial [Gemmatimonadaceae bacterium]
MLLSPSRRGLFAALATVAFLPPRTAAQRISARTDSISLAEALERARTSRPAAALGRGLVSQARGEASVVTALPNPTLQYERADFEPISTYRVTQPLAWIVERPSDVVAARATRERGIADSAQTLAELGGDVLAAYFEAVAGQEALRVALELAAVSDSVVRLAERRVAAGDISALERDQFAQEALRARLALSRARESARAAIAALALAVAPGHAADLVPRDALDLGLDAVTAARARADSATVSSLPRVRAALAAARSAEATASAARWAMLPIPSVFVARECCAVEGSNNLLGFSLPVPLLSQGRELAAERAGAATIARARAEETRLSEQRRLQAVIARYDESRLRAQLSRDSLALTA